MGPQMGSQTGRHMGIAHHGLDGALRVPGVFFFVRLMVIKLHGPMWYPKLMYVSIVF